MLDVLGINDWIVILTAIAVVAFWVGWITDQILDDHGFGLTINVLMVGWGALAGLHALDWLFLHYYLSPRYANSYVWFSGCLGAGTGLLMLACLARTLLRRA